MNGLTNDATESADTTTPRAKRRVDYTSGHKRSISGNLLSKLTLLRTAGGEQDKPDDGLGSTGGAMAEAVQTQQKPRRRKGSLRKTTLSRVSIPSIRSSIASVDPASSSASIATGPPPEPLDASTEDEDDLMLQPSSSHHHHHHQQRNHSSLMRKLSSNTSSTTDSYFPFQEPTPYAPPELEDDPTLPIVGYYPALTVLTGVMAWVWVVVAWVGMKYFRHASTGSASSS
ncbi:hypothetical protein DV736_g3208, partial [Chaetothyriales sp. CBS 134916]